MGPGSSVGPGAMRTYLQPLPSRGRLGQLAETWAGREHGAPCAPEPSHLGLRCQTPRASEAQASVERSTQHTCDSENLWPIGSLVLLEDSGASRGLPSPLPPVPAATQGPQLCRGQQLGPWALVPTSGLTVTLGATPLLKERSGHRWRGPSGSEWQLDLGGDRADVWQSHVPCKPSQPAASVPGVHLPGLWDWPLTATLKPLAVGEVTTVWQGQAVCFSSKHLGPRPEDTSTAGPEPEAMCHLWLSLMAVPACPNP